MTIDLDALLRGQQDYLDSIEPVDVPVMLGDTSVTVRIPFVMPKVFNDLANHHPPRPGVQADLPLSFNLDGTTRNYPDITLIDGDDVDDLLVVREKAVHYRWPEVYDALTSEDQSTVRMAVWGMHVFEPAERQKRIMREKAQKREAQNG
ncbi:MAG: hypothetical protein ACQEW8_07350 [Actinomycetota bacterium]